MKASTVLIVASQPEFARDLVARWQTERLVPNFTVIGTHSEIVQGGFDVALVGPMPQEALGHVLRSLDRSDAGQDVPVIAIAADAAAASFVRSEFPRVNALRQSETWLDVAVLLANEMLRRVETAARLRRLEQASAEKERHAALGVYMLQMRHSFNNALTSVLGNAELLLLDPQGMSEQARDQVNTMHNMTLRLHEIMQRFSSLEAEMTFAEKASQKDTVVMTRAAVSGQ